MKNRIMSAGMFITAIAGASHAGAVNAMTEWGEIVRSHSYSPGFDIWMSITISVVAFIIGLMLAERDFEYK